MGGAGAGGREGRGGPGNTWGTPAPVGTGVAAACGRRRATGRAGGQWAGERGGRGCREAALWGGRPTWSRSVAEAAGPAPILPVRRASCAAYSLRELPWARRPPARDSLS